MSSISNSPLVSVCMITYNHEAFISEAIEGVLVQKTAFPIDLVISDDCSSDRTGEICREYQAKYPDVIRLLNREHNLGMQKNFMSTIQACSGKYVALCEGDDYWTDPLKLQRQVDFLEANPDFAVCHHRLRIRNEDDPGDASFTPKSPEILTFEELAKRQYIGTASCVFRNKLFQFPDFFLEVPSTDYALHLLNSFHGKIKFIDETMGVYRLQSGGEWTRRAAIDKGAAALETTIRCRAHFYPHAQREFDFHVSRLNCFLAFEERRLKEYRSQYLGLLKKYSRWLKLREVAALTSRFFLTYFPRSIERYTRVSSKIKNEAESA